MDKFDSAAQLGNSGRGLRFRDSGDEDWRHSVDLGTDGTTYGASGVCAKYEVFGAAR